VQSSPGVLSSTVGDSLLLKAKIESPVVETEARHVYQGDKMLSDERHSATAPQRHSATAPQRHSAAARQREHRHLPPGATGGARGRIYFVSDVAGKSSPPSAMVRFSEIDKQCILTRIPTVYSIIQTIWNIIGTNTNNHPPKYAPTHDS